MIDVRAAGRSGLTHLDALTTGLQRQVGERVKRDLTDLLVARHGPPAESFRRSAEDPGLFDEDSVVWKVHANRSGLVGGLRALLLQTVHPLAMAGVAQHSDYRQDPWGRLHRTGAFIGVTTYGSTSAAEAAIDRVRKVHERVQGVAADGRPYRANDPHLLAWVHDTEVDSFLRAYQRYGDGDLTPADQDRYVAEMAEVAERMGVTQPPRSRRELRAALLAFRPELTATADAREAVRFLLWPPLPTYLRPAYGALSAAAIGLLPLFVRRQLRLVSGPVSDPLIVRPAVRLLLSGMTLALGDEPPSAEMARRERSRAAAGLEPTEEAPTQPSAEVGPADPLHAAGPINAVGPAIRAASRGIADVPRSVDQPDGTVRPGGRPGPAARGDTAKPRSRLAPSATKPGPQPKPIAALGSSRSRPLLKPPKVDVAADVSGPLSPPPPPKPRRGRAG